MSFPCPETGDKIRREDYEARLVNRFGYKPEQASAALEAAMRGERYVRVPAPTPATAPASPPSSGTSPGVGA